MKNKMKNMKTKLQDNMRKAPPRRQEKTDPRWRTSAARTLQMKELPGETCMKLFGRKELKEVGGRES